MTSSRHVLVHSVSNASDQVEQLDLGSREIIDAAASSPSESEQPPVKRKRTGDQNASSSRKSRSQTRTPQLSTQVVPPINPQRHHSQTRTPQLSVQGGLPTNPPVRVRKVPRHALQHAVLMIRVLLDEEPAFEFPHAISAYECTSARKLTRKIKEAYGRAWQKLPRTVSTKGIRVKFPHQQNAIMLDSNERAFAEWFHELGLYAADNPNECFPAAEIAVVLETTEEVQNCFFTDGNIEVSHDRAAMNEALGIGQEGGDWTVSCSGRYLKGLEQEKEVREAEIEVKDKEIESLRKQLRRKEAEVQWLKSLVESEEVEEQQEQPTRMPVGGLSLPR